MVVRLTCALQVWRVSGVAAGAAKCGAAVSRHRRAVAARLRPRRSRTALSRAPLSMLARRVLALRRALLSQAIRPLRTCTPMADAAAAGAEPSGAALDGAAGADGAAPVLGPDGQPISKSALKKMAKLKELEAKKAASAAAAAARASTAAKTPTTEESAAAAKKVSSAAPAPPPAGAAQTRLLTGTDGGERSRVASRGRYAARARPVTEAAAAVCTSSAWRGRAAAGDTAAAAGCATSGFRPCRLGGAHVPSRPAASAIRSQTRGSPVPPPPAPTAHHQPPLLQKEKKAVEKLDYVNTTPAGEKKGACWTARGGWLEVTP